MSELEHLRALRELLPRCEHYPCCGRLATREYANAPGYTRACDNPAHTPNDPINHPVRELPYAEHLRRSLTP